jgi:hypothetical protein
MSIKDEPYLAAEGVLPPHRSAFPTEVDVVCEKIEDLRASKRGVSADHRKQDRFATEWLIECLSLAAESIPGQRLALSQRPSHYSPDGSIKGRFGYKTVIKRVIPALASLGWIEEHTGFFFGSGKSMTTRYAATGALLVRILENRCTWRRLVQDTSDLIQVFTGRKATKKRIPTPVIPAASEWRNNLERFNEFLLEQAICLNITDAELAALETRITSGWSASPHEKSVAVNFRNVCLRRIFSRGSLEMGGRFYGGWWQLVPSEYRQWIAINGSKTVELDYSSMAIRILYARDDRDLGTDDAYDLGIPDPTPEKRQVIKIFINAMLNASKSRGFRLKPEQAAIVEMTHADLLKKVNKRHPWLSKYFHSEVGLSLQFDDSRIAEMIMLNMMDHYLVPVLPVHDSFLVRAGYVHHLESEMQDAFKAVTGRPALIKLEHSQPSPGTALPVVDGILSVTRPVIDRLITPSCFYRYTRTSPNGFGD